MYEINNRYKRVVIQNEKSQGMTTFLKAEKSFPI